MTLKILYASFQLGGELPGYVRYALSKLSKCGSVALITNRRELAARELDFLANSGIELFLTENRGFDFGMWQRYLDAQNWHLAEGTRIALINDSIVYYKDRFKEFFVRAEALDAEAVSLTENFEIAHHLQSFFLYLKPRAIGLLKEHLAKTPVQETYSGAVRNHEIAFSVELVSAGLKLEPLFKTREPILFSYAALIRSGAGFVKRKLLERRFTAADEAHFIICGFPSALREDYHKLIASEGSPDPDFDLALLPRNSATVRQKVAGFFAGHVFLWRRQLAKMRGKI